MKNELQRQRLILCIVHTDLIDVSEIDAKEGFDFVVLDAFTILVI